MMIRNKFYETFCPTEEDLQRIKEEVKKISKEAAEEKHCVACSHYTYDDSVPGFVTYEGDCDMGHVAFFGDHPDGPCPDWEWEGEEEE